MKIIMTCPHIQMDMAKKEELRREFQEPIDGDKRFFQITELCFECGLKAIREWYYDAEEFTPRS